MKINLEAPFNTTSYGYVSCFVLSELIKSGCDVYAQPISSIIAENKFAKDIEESIQKPFHHDAINLKIWHQHSLHGKIGKGPSVGFTIFELEEFSSKEKHSIEFPDHLFVPSQWAKDVVTSQTKRTNKNTHVIPLGIDPAVFKPAASRIQDKTVFLNAGKWEIRKGHDVLIEAFRKAFKEGDSVELWMMPHNPFLTKQQTYEWENYYLGDKIKIMDRQNTQIEVYNIMRDAHCGVFPARAEGWNLELLEMMAIGKPVITTNCTAHTEFCNPKNAMLIDMEEKEAAFDGQFFNGFGSWYSFKEEQVDNLVHYMRLVHEKRLDGRLETNSYGTITGNNYTWEMTARQMMKQFVIM